MKKPDNFARESLLSPTFRFGTAREVERTRFAKTYKPKTSNTFHPLPRFPSLNFSPLLAKRQPTINIDIQNS